MCLIENHSDFEDERFMNLPHQLQKLSGWEVLPGLDVFNTSTESDPSAVG
jgi:hypothetical protein